MIPLFQPSVTNLEIDAVTEVLKSHWWGLGPQVEKLEEEFAKKMSVKYAVAVNSCTAALDMAVKATVGESLDPGFVREQGEQPYEIILPALTFVSDGLAALYNNYRVVFADIDEETLNIDPVDVAKKITKETKAIIPVHYSGRLSIIPKLLKYNAPTIIEDCAHAAGTRQAGVWGKVGCWSFHAVKNIASGDGGMITTNDDMIYKKLLPMRWCGIDKSTWERSQKKYGWDYSIETIGYKYHMNDITAALALVQLQRLDETNEKRRKRVREYLSLLKNISWLRLPKWDENSSWHMFVVRVDEKIRNKFIDYLLDNGISAGVHYKPLNTYKIFPQTKLPVTDKVWKQLVTLPLFPDMTDSQMEYIILRIINFKP